MRLRGEAAAAGSGERGAGSGERGAGRKGAGSALPSVVMLEVITALRAALAQVERRDSDLARQLRRASASVALDTAEGMYSRGKKRQARYHNALGSARPK